MPTVHTAAAHLTALNTRQQELAGLVSGESSLRAQIDGYKGGTKAWITANRGGGVPATKEGTEEKASEAAKKYFTLKIELGKLSAFSRDLQAGIEATKVTPISLHDLDTLKLLSPELAATARKLQKDNTGKSEHLKEVKTQTDKFIETTTERLRLLSFEVTRVVLGAATTTGVVPWAGPGYYLGIDPVIVDPTPDATAARRAEAEKALEIAEEEFVAVAPTGATKSFQVSHDEAMAKIKAQGKKHFEVISKLSAIIGQLTYILQEARSEDELTEVDLVKYVKVNADLVAMLGKIKNFKAPHTALKQVEAVKNSYLYYAANGDAPRVERTTLNENTIETLQKLSPELTRQALALQTVWSTTLLPYVAKTEGLLAERVTTLNEKKEEANELMNELSRFIDAVKAAQPTVTYASLTAQRPRATTRVPTTAARAPVTAGTAASGEGGKTEE